MARDPICKQCASGEPGIPELCTCGDYPTETITALRSEVERLTKDRAEALRRAMTAEAQLIIAAPLYSRRPLEAKLEAAEAENDRLRGELARVERETVERCAKVADAESHTLDDDFDAFNNGYATAAENIATAIRALEPRHV